MTHSVAALEALLEPSPYDQIYDAARGEARDVMTTASRHLAMLAHDLDRALRTLDQGDGTAAGRVRSIKRHAEKAARAMNGLLATMTDEDIADGLPGDEPAPADDVATVPGQYL